MFIHRYRNGSTGEVLEMTPAELRIARMRRRMRAWSRATNGIGGDMIMVTLTYRDVDGWSSRHVSEFMRHVRRHLGGRLMAYSWVAELQRRGAVHYHVLLRVSPGTRIPLPDDAGWWVHGMTRVDLVRNVTSVAGYVSKYLGKGTDAPFPVGLRLFAVVVRAMLADRRWRLRWLSTPMWVREAVDAQRVDVDVGTPIAHVSGGWRIGDVLIPSPWRFSRLWVAG